MKEWLILWAVLIGIMASGFLMAQSGGGGSAQNLSNNGLNRNVTNLISSGVSNVCTYTGGVLTSYSTIP